jgi:anti-sigma B factor antagonist
MNKDVIHKIVPLEGEIDLHLSPEVAKRLQAAVKERPDKLLIDLSKVTYIDSSGLAALLEGMQGVEFYGGKFYLIGMQESLRPIFESSRLDQVFRILPDTGAALGAT